LRIDVFMRIRPIVPEDRTAVVELLVEGFPSRSGNYWKAAFDFLAKQDTPANHLQFGSVMEHNAQLVGVLLLIWTPTNLLPEGQMRANLSSWYVKTEYRSLAAMLLAKVSRSAAVTYTNVSPAPNTIEICLALGFKQYSSGQSVCLPLLGYNQSVTRVSRFEAGRSGLDPVDDAIAAKHVAMGCLAFVSQHEGKKCLFLFVRRKVKNWIPAAQLVFCDSIDAFRACARALGGALAKHGLLLIICDANGRLEQVPSIYFHGKVPKYFKGPDTPRIGDLSFTEIPVFGI
jgi:hypothetical protein